MSCVYVYIIYYIIVFILSKTLNIMESEIKQELNHMLFLGVFLVQFFSYALIQSEL